MPLVRFETADSPDRTRIGEGLVRFAVEANRLETGRAEGKYFLRHGDGCGVCEARIDPGDGFVFDTDSGEVLCAAHGRARDDDA
jgi:hypothetical protein